MTIRELLTEAQSSNDFFRRYYARRNEEKRQFSLRAFSKKLGYSNPSLLSEVMRDKRKASLDLANRFFEVEDLDFLEQMFLTNLVCADSSTSPAVTSTKLVQNKYIRECWKISRANGLPPKAVPEDMLIRAVISRAGRTRVEDVASELAVVIDPTVTLHRLQYLSEVGAIEVVDGYVGGNWSERGRIEHEEFRSVAGMIERLQSLTRDDHDQMVMGIALTQESHLQARQIMRAAWEKVILLAMKDEEQAGVSDQRQVFSMYSSIARISRGPESKEH